MSYVAERATVNQTVQFGAESLSALGTAVPANKLLECYSFNVGIEADVVFYTGTGRKYPALSEENMEWTAGSISGIMDYNGLIYPLEGAMGNVGAVAHLSSTTAKDWIFAPPITGSIEPQTYTVQQGDATRSHQLAYVLFNEFGYKGTRKEFTVDAKFFGQKLSDGITKTSSPTAIALAPVVANQVNVYLDTSQGTFGTTLLSRFLSIDFSMSNIYSPLWVINRANPSFVSHVDTLPKTSGKLKVEADTQGMGLLANLQAGTTVYLQVDAMGPQIASDGPGAVNNEIKHQMAIKIGKPSPFSDDSGVFAIEWEFEVVEDSTWGHSQILTVTNLLTAL